MILKNIKLYCQEEKERMRQVIDRMDQKPQLAIIQLGENEASNRYVRNKIKDCQEVGIIAHHYGYDEDITTEDLILEIEDLQAHYDGIIVQLPLPVQIDYELVKSAIDPAKDVDGFHPMSAFEPATPSGIMDYLKDCGFQFKGGKALVIGRSKIVGRPMAKMLLDADMTVTVAHSKTDPAVLKEMVGGMDLIICAVGKAKFLDCSLARRNAIIVDVGINFDENGKMIGDCYNTEQRVVTPVPGGVGLLTRLALIKNVVRGRKGDIKNA